jgi:hypothetical protein
MAFEQAFYRVQQYLNAKNAKLDEADITIVRQYLSIQEQILFFRMDVSDQAHTLEVAKKIIIAENLKAKANHYLIKISLLHDVGKGTKPLSLNGRVAWVLLQKLGPSISDTSVNLFKNSSIPFFYTPYILKNHAQLSYKLLTAINCDKDICDTILKHHDETNKNDSQELLRLRNVDSNT